MDKDFSHCSLLDVKYINKLTVTLSRESFKIEFEEFYWWRIYKQGFVGEVSCVLQDFWALWSEIHDTFECPFKLQNTSVEKVDTVSILLHIWEQEKQQIFWKNAGCYFSACIKPQTIV